MAETPAFLSGGGTMGALMHAHDWSMTPLGPPDTWPQSLRSTLSACLNSPILGTILWGPELLMLYNDAYIPSMADRHPDALGRPVAEVWGSAWEQVAPPFRRAMATGEGFSQDDVELPMVRRGRAEITYWNFSAGPIRGEDGSVVGLFNQGIEITEQVLSERALRASDERQRRLLQQMPGFVAVLAGPDHVYEYVNEAYLTISGPREILGRTVRAVFPELVGQGFYELLDQVYATGEPYAARAVPIRLAGESADRFIDMLYQPIKTGAGAVTGIFVGGYDVTEENRSAAALRDLNADLERQVTERSRERSRTWQVTTDLLAVADAQGFFIRTNPAWRTLLGWSEDELARTPFIELVHPDDRVGTLAAFRHLKAGDPVLRFENRYRTKGGDHRWLSWVAVPEDGLFYCSARDVSEDKDRAATLHLYENIIQSGASPICAFDTGFRLIAFNQAHDDEFFRVQGRRTRIGDVFPDLFLSEQAAMMRGLMTRALAGEAFTVVEEFGTPERGIPHWEITYTPLRDTAGTIVGAFHHAQDISGRLRAETELHAAQEALRQSQKMEAVGQLTGGLAHDFNNLLAGISGSLELLQTRMGQGRMTDLDRYINAAQGASKRAAALTHRLLAFSRRQTLDPKPTNVNGLVSGMEELIRRTVGPAVHVEVVGASGLWTTLVDPPQLENALLNLCINARDAMPDGGRITIETANKWLDERAATERDLPPGQYLSLCVTDTGTGMPPDVIARAFDPFFTTKPIGQGTGLGLSMIYGFVRQSGGHVRIYSEVGDGTTMCLYLPRHYGEAEEADVMASLSDAPRAEQGQTVLVVDDEPTVRMLVAEVLEDLGYTAIEAGDGPAGLKVLRSDVRIDLLVTDVGLPGGMNGRQVADAARVTRPDLKVLFITGYAENAVVGNGHLDPGMAVLTKPFVMEALASRIRELIAAT